MSTEQDAIAVVERFCEAIAGGDLDAVVAFFSDDAVYHNIPIEPVVGPAAIRSTLESFTSSVDSLEFKMLAIAASGSTVLTERIDIFNFPGHVLSLPVMGTFEVTDGKISAWRDYFDMQQFMSQLPPG